MSCLVNFPYNNFPYRCESCKKFIKLKEIHYAIRAYERQKYDEEGFTYENPISVVFICTFCAGSMNFSKLKLPTMFP